VGSPTLAELEHLVRHAGHSLELQRGRLRALAKLSCNELEGAGGTLAQVVALTKLFGAIDASLSHVEVSLKAQQCSCAEHPIAAENMATALPTPIRRFALVRKNGGAA
jgi:hypothetical protein